MLVFGQHDYNTFHWLFMLRLLCVGLQSCLFRCVQGALSRSGVAWRMFVGGLAGRAYIWDVLFICCDIGIYVCRSAYVCLLNLGLRVIFVRAMAR